jgi:hypothetical protein
MASSFIWPIFVGGKQKLGHASMAFKKNSFLVSIARQEKSSLVMMMDDG